MSEIVIEIIKSWSDKEGKVSSTKELFQWIDQLNHTTHVEISECSIAEDSFWFYDDYEGEILNRKRSFFSVKGLRRFVDGRFVNEQPIIIQPEIGYLGIICKKIKGTLHFLMQAKIEPGNVNCVQISPTIQATKSNFLRAHGGSLPKYFKYFEQSAKYNIIYDQIQSEQSSRFYKKRNRNMLIEIDEDIEVYPNFKWMTLGQLKELLKIDNLVNMDTRTVLSGIPIATSLYDKDDLAQLSEYIKDQDLFASMFRVSSRESIADIYHYINDYKMFKDIKLVQIPLYELVDWKVSDKGIDCIREADFLVRYYDISIQDREVQKWTQPLFKAKGMAEFGLIFCRDNGVIKYLVSARAEIGSFDKLEIGPSVQLEATHNYIYDNQVEKLFHENIKACKGIHLDVLLSEEGGRFYHEQNRNIIMEIEKTSVELPEGYFWTEYRTINELIQINNCVNIQLRNLMSLIDI